MAINLTEHAVYIDTLKTDMVPLSIALQAVAEAYGDSKLDEAMTLIKQSVDQMNSAFKSTLEND